MRRRKRGSLRPIDGILVVIDFSPACRKTVRYAVELAGRVGASLTLLHVIEPEVCIADFGYGPVCRAVADPRLVENARRHLKAIARRIAQRGTITITGTAVRCGSVGAAVADEAYQVEANLIVVACCLNPAEPQKGGKLPEIIARAPCPVLIVPEHKPERIQNETEREPYERETRTSG